MEIRRLIRRAAHLSGVHIHRWPSDRHLELNYPIKPLPRYGYGRPVHPQIESILSRERDVFESELQEMLAHQDLVKSIPATTEDQNAPFWSNGYFAPLDALALMHFLVKNRPAQYLEIGSGNSTKYARHAINHSRLATKIISLDPEPRAGIDLICDEIVRQPLEAVDLDIFKELSAGDILFFDGSHRLFTNSDVAVFFLDVLPAVRSGVLIHIHDIFWPSDYPPSWSRRYYSEQYMLGALLLNETKRYKILLANSFISQDRNLSEMANLLNDAIRYTGQTLAVSFWMTVA